MQTTLKQIETSTTPYLVRWFRPDDIESYWPHIWKECKRASRGNYALSEEQLKHELISGRRGLWAILNGDIHAFVVLEALDKQLFIHTISGGGMSRWANVLEAELKIYAKAIGATCIRAYTRDGFVKYLSNRGWKKAATIMELDLDG